MRTNGQGSIVQLEKGVTRSKCRRWQLQVSVGRNPITGRYEKRSRNVSGNYTSARRELRDFISEIESETISTRPSGTLAEYARSWYGSRLAAGDVSARTLASDDYRVSKLERYLGAARMSDVTKPLVEGAFQRMMDDGLSSRSVIDIAKTWGTIIRCAERDGMLPMGLADSIVKPRSDSKPRNALTGSQVDSLLSSLDMRLSMHGIIMVAVTCGLRRSEIAALNVEDVDGRYIRVSKAVNEDGTIKSTKSRKGVRTIPMAARSQEMMGRWLDWRRAQNDVEPGSPLFPNRFGERYKPHVITQWWSRHRQTDFGLDCSLHDLRRTYATMLARNNVSIKTTMDLLGDSSTDVVLGVYQQVADEEMVAAMDSLFGDDSQFIRSSQS